MEFVQLHAGVNNLSDLLVFWLLGECPLWQEQEFVHAQHFWQLDAFLLPFGYHFL